MSETLEFKAELKQLLHLITHSLYSDREIFLRELISNASDAINKVKFDSLDREDRLEGNKDWKIKIVPDKAAGTLTVSDNGVGMSRDEAIDHLGTVAKSGTKAFLEAIKAKNAGGPAGLIGQFGVGFYSAFMVADKVTVHTRPAGGPESGARWESDGQGNFTIDAADKPTRGTDVVLHLKDDAKEFLDPWRVRQLVKKFSDFIEHPVAMDKTEEEDGQTTTTEEVLNNRKAVWLRAKSEVTKEEYDEFYKQLGHDPHPPARVLHFAVEGKTEFKALLYIPSRKPFGLDWEEPTSGLRLYAQRVLIMDRCEQLLPPYLRFVKGVVDSADLPLNVSREMLQSNPHLDTIQKNLLRNVLSGLEAIKNTEYDAYVTFFQSLGGVLKEGLSRDWANKEKVADLILFRSANTPADKYTTLKDYVAAMPEGQSHILYLTGDSADALRNSPYLEAAKKKGYDVLLLSDPVDLFAVPALGEYKGKPLHDAARDESADKADEVPAFVTEQYAGLLAALKAKLPAVADVRLTTRLTESASCLVADAGDMTAHLERMMRRFGETVEDQKRVLELNPNHPAVTALRDLHAATPDDPRVDNFAHLLHAQAVIAEGTRVDDPVGLAQRINEMFLKDADPR